MKSERERDRQREIERETDRQTDRQADRQAEVERERDRNNSIHKLLCQEFEDQDGSYFLLFLLFHIW